MCRGCWNEYLEDSDTLGVPGVITTEITATVAAIGAVYMEDSTGGAIHVAIDDWNLDDDSIAFCGSKDNPSGTLTAAELNCYDLLAKLSKLQRATALAIYDGFHTVEDDK